MNSCNRCREPGAVRRDLWPESARHVERNRQAIAGRASAENARLVCEPMQCTPTAQAAVLSHLKFCNRGREPGAVRRHFRPESVRHDERAWASDCRARKRGKRPAGLRTDAMHPKGQTNRALAFEKECRPAVRRESEIRSNRRKPCLPTLAAPAAGRSA